MHYSTGYCFCAYDLFETFNKKQLKIKKSIITKKYGLNKRQRLCASVLVYCFYLILLDIIENNITFVLPLIGKKQAYIYIRPIKEENLRRAVQHGAFSEIDFLSSNFTGYMLTYSWLSCNGYKYKPIYISRKFKDVLIQHINKGKVYF